MKLIRYMCTLLLLFCAPLVVAQSGEPGELSPEELDAAFTAEDAAREAAAWSSVVIQQSNTDPLGRMTDSADLVFQGVVESQEYVFDQKGRPFTHTTFAITELLEGSYSEPEITVVQEGGPDKNDPDSVIFVSGTRYFSEGEEEVLFLNLDPGQSHPPRKVKIAERFRIYGGQVYDENGRGIKLIPSENGKGHRLGIAKRRNPAPRFQKIKIGEHTFSKQFAPDDDYPDSGGEEVESGKAKVQKFGRGEDMRNFNAAIASKKEG